MKIVRENINFERGTNPLDSMNIGRVRERRMGKIRKILETFGKTFGKKVRRDSRDHPRAIAPGGRRDDRLPQRISVRRGKIS